ncbi:photosystem I assembly protein Ycf3 [Fuerstiella marisgermanici]|uniref:Photosystem I assembly protein Ycf3 n=2 Tax=Fuerstiella marisgermanici TaxID=1891926 RepID=A0A1P8WGT0_9PLAN|nr:photosystem I assembly protein Ycf3 [Fuerstiella marisgermanici]
MITYRFCTQFAVLVLLWLHSFAVAQDAKRELNAPRTDGSASQPNETDGTKTLGFLEKLLGQHHAESERRWNEAVRLRENGQLDEATRKFEQLLKFDRANHGEDSVAQVESLGELCTIADDKADYKALLNYRERQAVVAKKIYKNGSFQLRSIETKLADAKHVVGFSEEELVKLEALKATYIKAEAQRAKGYYKKSIRELESGLRLASDLFGSKHWRVADFEWRLGIAYKAIGNLEEAEKRLSEAVKLNRMASGGPSPDAANALSQLSNVYASQSAIDQAVESARDALDMFEETLGDQHPRYAAALLDLGVRLIDQRDFKAAETTLGQADSLLRWYHGPQHPEYFRCTQLRAELYQSMGQYDKAERYYQRSVTQQKERVGENHPDYARVLGRLSDFLLEAGDAKQALQISQQAMLIINATLGDKHSLFAASLNNQAIIYVSLGEYWKAEQNYRKVLEIARETTGSNDSEYAITLTNLGIVYEKISDYDRAKDFYFQALQISESAKGKNSLEYADSLCMLSDLYVGINDFEKAEEFQLAGMRIRENVLSPQDYQIGVCHNDLAILYDLKGDAQQALNHYEIALAITSDRLGIESYQYAQQLRNLAVLHSFQGDNEHAKALHSQSLEIVERLGGKKHPEYANAAYALALDYRELGQFEIAKTLFIDSLALSKEIHGEQHPEYLRKVPGLAWNYIKQGENAQGLQLLEKALTADLDAFDRKCGLLPERLQLEHVEQKRAFLNGFITLALEHAPDKNVIASQALRWKGAVRLNSRNMRVAASDPQLKKRFDSLQSVVQRYSALANSGPRQSDQGQWKLQINTLLAKRDSLEADLMRDSEAFRASRRRFSTNEVRASIPENAVLVDYHVFPRRNHGVGIMCSIVPRDGEIRVIDLGNAAGTREALEVWRSTLGQSEESKLAGQKLRDQLWEPFFDFIADKTLILISPDGLLGRVPFAALPGHDPERYLIEDHRISIIPVPQLLPTYVGRSKLPPVERELLLVGDVDYDGKSKSDPISLVESQRPRRPWERSGQEGRRSWSHLSETRLEVDSIGGVYRRVCQPPPQAVVDLRQDRATETAFREFAPQCRILHVATHGYFAAPDVESAVAARSQHNALGEHTKSSRGGRRETLRGFSPGLLSGLVFAGANEPSESQVDDGVLTADEVAFLQLNGVQLAVLSACETGLGEVAGGEGLLGLQRAFQIAGARTTIASLWKVNDAATRRLMQEFYSNLLDQEMSCIDALREAQLYMLNNPSSIRGAAIEPNRTDSSQRIPPYFWAAFQLSGDWR